jgi:hypothetical protein
MYQYNLNKMFIERIHLNVNNVKLLIIYKVEILSGY